MGKVVGERGDVREDCRALAQVLGPLLGRLTILLRREVSHLALTPAQVTVLSLLLDGPHRMSDLAHLAGVSQPSMTVLVDRMERQGWVHRTPDPADRRGVQVEITPRGREAIVEVQAARAEALAHRLIGLSDEDRVAIGKSLPALRALLDH